MHHHRAPQHAVRSLCRRTDSVRSMSRRGSASGRMASLSKSLSQVLTFPVSGRDRWPAATPASASSVVAAPGTVPAAADAAAGTAAEQPPAFPPNSVAVSLPVM